MTPAITLEELLAWNEEASGFWKAHLDANPALLELPCGIGGAANVQEFVRHIWGVELRWAQRWPACRSCRAKRRPPGRLTRSSTCTQAVEIFRDAAGRSRRRTGMRPTRMDVAWVPPRFRDRHASQDAAHALFHSQRHWAQLATLVRAAGFPSGFRGDLFFSSALR